MVKIVVVLNIFVENKLLTAVLFKYKSFVKL